MIIKVTPTSRYTLAFKTHINISQRSVATPLKCGGTFYCKFRPRSTAKWTSEIIVKISLQLMKFRQNFGGWLFWLILYVRLQKHNIMQKDMRQISMRYLLTYLMYQRQRESVTEYQLRCHYTLCTCAVSSDPHCICSHHALTSRHCTTLWCLRQLVKYDVLVLLIHVNYKLLNVKRYTGVILSCARR